MMNEPAEFPYKRALPLLLSAVLLVAVISCSPVKNYPARPFVYQTNIHINGKYNADDKKQLTEQLDQQLDDSIRVHRTQKLLFWKVLKNPPVFDSINVAKSTGYMHVLLNSLGYYRDSITPTTTKTQEDNQQRVTVDFYVTPGKLFTLDSVSYTLRDSSHPSPQLDTLQNLTARTANQALVKKGSPFSKPLISGEFDRLSDLYRNNGFLRFTRDELVALWDTVGLDLLRPTLDPIEQAQLLEQLRIRREHPSSDLEIRLRPRVDTSHLIRYYVGKVTVYPDYSVDTLNSISNQTTFRQFRFVFYRNLFKPKKLYDYIYLKPGELYRQSNLVSTQNKFNSLGAWSIVTINQLPRPNEDTADFEIKLTPARKYAFTANLEGSENQGNNLIDRDFLGLGVNFALQNRNFAHAANQSSTSVRLNTEISPSLGQFFQTRQVILNHSINFPRVVPRLRWLSEEDRKNTRTIFAMNAGFTDRITYYNITTLSTSWGYEYTGKSHRFSIRFPNIEYNLLTRRDSLEALISRNASFKYIFNNGLILSTIGNYQLARSHKNVTSLTNISVELAGLATYPLRSSFLDSNLYHFIKTDAEFRQTYLLGARGRNAFAWRIFGGVGVSLLRSRHDSVHFYLPFFREYFAGGPNSMRAWAVRRLGPGSAIKSFGQTAAPDRFGDMRLETNAEFRFYLGNINGIILNGAFFTDVGNVWFLHENPDFPGGEFKVQNLWRDLAIGSGTGLRVDFGFFKLRFDYAYKVKNPSPDVSEAASQNKWFYNWTLLNGQFQLGIDYPF
jgi:outer membrane protein insertion porin family